jgi:ribose 5-phosphate isomerase B
MTMETIAIASDHTGVELKSTLAAMLDEAGYAVQDLGTTGTKSVDYPDYADRMAEALGQGPATRGVLICGTGVGIAMAANRHRGLRAALCHDAVTARMGRAHNAANVLVLGARIVGAEVAKDCLRVFLDTPFEGGRHAQRVAKMS